jgi:glycosyltransferase involved in cell wall biosynthesis
LKKLAIITTHPIQYNAPFFALLAKSKIVQPKVFYTWGESVLHSKYDPGFGKNISWDVPLLEGYAYEFLENTAAKKGSHHYNGIVNPDIISSIKKFDADAILVYGWKFRSHLKVMKHFKNKVPVWFRGDSTLLDEKRNFKSLLKKTFLKWVYRHIDIAFHTGTYNRDYFLEYGLRPDQLILAPHAVDNERFFNTDGCYTMQAQALKKKLRIRPGRIVFLFAGKLEPKKDPGILLAAFSAIPENDAHLVITGNGKEESYLKERYRNHENISFLDFQNQQAMPVIYQLCDVFVLPSAGPGESWGLALNEAMAAGKAVIASDKCGGAADLIREGENGYIFEAGNAADLLGKMELATQSPDRLRSLQRRSVERIQAFSFNSFITAIEKAAGKNGK